MAFTQLELYNGALVEHCGERPLATITENREPRRLLDNAWTEGIGAISACLEMGQWNFAMRTQMQTPDTGITPTFGYRYVYPHPTDWILTTAVWQDEFGRVPLLQYTDEAGKLYASLQTIYWRYVSNDANFGSNMGLWPQSFADVVKAYLAQKIISKLTDSQVKIDNLTHHRTGAVAKAVHFAKNMSAMAEPTKFPPTGSWNRSRLGHRRYRDGGSTSSLIG